MGDNNAINQEGLLVQYDTMHLFFDVRILLLVSVYAGGSEDPTVGHILISTYAILITSVLLHISASVSNLKFYRNFQQNLALI